MVEDVESVPDDVRNTQLALLVHSLDFAFPGTKGFSSDASASRECGWGVHAFGSVASGAPTTSTRMLIVDGCISINPLEMLASTVAVVLLGRTGKRGGHQQVALRGDNATASRAANKGIATARP